MATDPSSVKGILKTSSSLDEGPQQELKWDEMNILATYHPANKDYGHQKIDEPPTPYSHLAEEDMEDGEETEQGVNPGRSADPPSNGVNPGDLAARLLAQSDEVPKALRVDDSSSDEEAESPEAKAKRKQFESKRSNHYNEFQAMKLAQQLMQEEEDEEEGEEEDQDDEDEEDIGEHN